MALYEDNQGSFGGSNTMDPISALITGGAALLGSIFSGTAQRSAARSQAQAAQKTAAEQLQFQREAGLLGMEASMEEARRRQQEGAYQAGRLEDVIRMFEAMQAIPGQQSEIDLRRAAMRELGMGAEGLNAMLAAQGLRGSGYGAMQARGMTGDVLANLAQSMVTNQLQQRELEMGRIGSIGNILSNEAFAAAAPLDLSRQQQLRDYYAQQWNVNIPPPAAGMLAAANALGATRSGVI